MDANAKFNLLRSEFVCSWVSRERHDGATGQGLLNYFPQAINCGAIDEAEAVKRTGLSIEDFVGRSFLKILQRRRGFGDASSTAADGTVVRRAHLPE